MTKRCTATAKAGLHLVNDEEDIVLLAEVSCSLQVSIGRYVDTVYTD